MSTDYEYIPLRISFGNPSVEQIDGIAWLKSQRNVETVILGVDEDSAENSDTDDGNASAMICVFNIPAGITIGELYSFMAGCVPSLLRVLVVRSVDFPGTYSVLLRFDSMEAAREFHSFYNNKPFHSLDSTLCMNTFLMTMEFQQHTYPRPWEFRGPSDPLSASEDGELHPLRLGRDVSEVSSVGTLEGEGIAQVEGDSNNQQMNAHDEGVARTCHSPFIGFHSHEHVNVPALEPPLTVSQKEPFCAVCQEAIHPNEKAQITILCNHVFHFECLSRWGDSTCPVCRYIMQPETPSSCSVCGVANDIWMCLLCGNCGCGRLTNAHALGHYESTNHTFALHVTTRRVWDYTEENFVHRVIQNKSDGKLVGVTRSVSGEVEKREDSKLGNIIMDYDYMLSRQLELQQAYFNDQEHSVVNEAQEKLSKLEVRQKELEDELSKRHQYISGLRVEITKWTNESQHLEETIEHMNTEVARVRKENNVLLAKQNSAKRAFKQREAELEQQRNAEIQEKNEEIRNLREENRELEFHLKTQKTLSSASPEDRDDIANGRLYI